MAQPIRNILRDFDNIRENLLAFSDDVWLNINHNDTKSMKEDITTWTRVYELVLRQLVKKDTNLFKALPNNPATITRRENPHFSTKPSELRKPLALPYGIYAETNLSANHLCKSIQTLLDIFAISSDSMTIFLRQDRDA